MGGIEILKSHTFYCMALCLPKPNPLAYPYFARNAFNFQVYSITFCIFMAPVFLIESLPSPSKNTFNSLEFNAPSDFTGKLLEYISEAQSGGAPMTASIATQVLKMFSSMNNEKGEDYNLSDREKQVLQLLVEGYSYKMIAGEMFISIDTVRSHIKKIYEKLHVNSKSEAVAKAFKDKIV